MYICPISSSRATWEGLKWLINFPFDNPFLMTRGLEKNDACSALPMMSTVLSNLFHKSLLKSRIFYLLTHLAGFVFTKKILYFITKYRHKKEKRKRKVQRNHFCIFGSKKQKETKNFLTNLKPLNYLVMKV